MAFLLHRSLVIQRLAHLVYRLPSWRSGVLRCLPRALSSGKGTVVTSTLGATGHPTNRRPTSSAIPKMNDCARVAAVLEAHATHGPRMKPID